jgi:tripartite-type tricarboxylate transporter receptor subunit TctC
MAMTGTAMLHVPYRGGAPAAQALVAKEVMVAFIDTITAKPLIEGGQVRPIGVSSPQPSAYLPQVSAIAESGVPGF